MSSNLPAELKQGNLALLREFKDVFAWTYTEMSGLDLQLFTKLNIKEETKHVKQSLPHFILELEIQIKQEVQKLLDVGFIELIQHPTWSLISCL